MAAVSGFKSGLTGRNLAGPEAGNVPTERLKLQINRAVACLRTEGLVEFGHVLEGSYEK
jgi:hypothetical protein